MIDWVQVTAWILSVGGFSLVAYSFGHAHGVKETEKRWSEAVTRQEYYHEEELERERMRHIE